MTRFCWTDLILFVRTLNEEPVCLGYLLGCDDVDPDIHNHPNASVHPPNPSQVMYNR
jgi:hypothetical protein